MSFFFDLGILLAMIYLIDNHWWLPLKTQWRKLGWVFALFGVAVIAIVTALFMVRLSSIS